MIESEIGDHHGWEKVILEAGGKRLSVSMSSMARASSNSKAGPPAHDRSDGSTKATQPKAPSGVPLRLGFAVKVLGRPGQKSNDSRRWQNHPHLRVSLKYLSQIFDYLGEQQISMYRMSSDLAPYASHPDMPQFHNMARECAKELRTLGARSRRQGLRLSFHPSQFVVLNSPDAGLVEKSVWDLRVQAEILDRMELGPEAVLVIHPGGGYGDRRLGCERWVRTWETLPPAVRSRLALENDDLRYSAADVLWIHERTGVRLVFDFQHFWCFNPEGLELTETLGKMLRTWPKGERAKIHFSTPRTELRAVERRNRKTKKKETVYLPPVWHGHSDFANPFEFIAFIRPLSHLEFDVMLESKAKDLSLIRLRRDLVRYAPDLAQRFGIEPALAKLDQDRESAIKTAPEDEQYR